MNCGFLEENYRQEKLKRYLIEYPKEATQKGESETPGRAGGLKTRGPLKAVLNWSRSCATI